MQEVTHHLVQVSLLTERILLCYDREYAAAIFINQLQASYNDPLMLQNMLMHGEAFNTLLFNFPHTGFTHYAPE